MKKLLSVLLVLLLLFSALPFAFAEDDLPDAVVAYGYFTPKNTDGSLLYLVMNSAYTKTTSALSAAVIVQNGIDRRQQVFSAEQLLAERVSFADGETTVKRFLLLVPLGSIDIDDVRGLTLPAKSFAGKKIKSPELRLGMPEELFFTEDLTFTSRLFRETKPLPQEGDLQVGAGDTLHLNATCDLPFAYWLGGSCAASCNGGDTLQKDVAAGSVGSRVLSLRVFSYVLTEHSFQVKKQTDLYRDAVLGVYSYVGALLLSPVVAPISYLFTGPLNIAAMLSPAMLLKTNPADVFKIFFSIFNLIRP